jgi:hypothetical protein
MLYVPSAAGMIEDEGNPFEIADNQMQYLEDMQQQDLQN